jgi:hypothetical protein
MTVFQPRVLRLFGPKQRKPEIRFLDTGVSAPHLMLVNKRKRLFPHVHRPSIRLFPGTTAPATSNLAKPSATAAVTDDSIPDFYRPNVQTRPAIVMTRPNGGFKTR